MEKLKEPVKVITSHKTHSSFSIEEAADNDNDMLPPEPETIPAAFNISNIIELSVYGHAPTGTITLNS